MSRVAFVTTGLGYGGAETQLARLVLELRRRGHLLSVISLLPATGFAEVLSEHGIPVFSLDLSGVRSFPSGAARLIVELRRQRPDVVVSFMYHANILTRLARRPSGIPRLVSSIRNEKFGGAGRELLTRFTDCLSEVTTTNSHLAAKRLLERKIVSPDRIRVIPNAVPSPSELPLDSDPAVSALRAQLHGSQTDFVWVTVGRLVPQKDHSTLLKAFASLLATGRRAQLYVAGDGPLRQSLESEASRLNVREAVRFLGFRRDVGELLRAADGFVLSSAWEGLPNVVMEALLAGLPIVATDVGGVSELVSRDAGVLVKPRSSSELAGGMIAVMDWAPSRRALVKEVASQFADRFSIGSIASQWEEVLFELPEVRRNSFR